MFSKVLKCFVFLGTLVLHTQAFWWRPPTTTESPTVLKQIPLTYFRTYTYQPLTGGPYTFPFFGAGGYGAPAPQAPILAGARYEHYASSYPMPQAQHQLPPLIEHQQFNRGPETPPQPLPPPPASTTTTTSSTTTTTTTTPPPPTTTTTTTTTTAAPPTTPSTTTTSAPSTTTTSSAPPSFIAPQQPIEPLINPGASVSFATQYGASAADYHHNYNRRVFTNNYGPPNYYRPHYPYPEYSTFNAGGASKLSNSYGGSGSRAGPPAHVQFVPCMCPVSVGVPSGLPIVGASGAGPSTATFSVQSRTAEDENEGVLDSAEMDLLHDSESTKSKIIIEPEVEPSLEKSGATTTAELTTVESHFTNKLDETSFEKSAYEKLNEPLVPLASSPTSGEEV